MWTQINPAQSLLSAVKIKTPSALFPKTQVAETHILLTSDRHVYCTVHVTTLPPISRAWNDTTNEPGTER